NPPPEHEAGESLGSSPVVQTVASPVADSPQVMRGGGESTSQPLMLVEAFGIPMPVIAAAVGAMPMGEGGVQALQGVAAPQAVRLSGAAVNYVLRQSGGTYNAGTAAEPEIRKLAPRWAPAHATAAQQIASDVTLDVGEKSAK